MTTATNGTTPATEATPTVANTPPAVTPAPKKRAPRVKKAVTPATLPDPTAKDPKNVAAVLNTFTGTAIQTVKEKTVVRKLLTSLAYLNGYAEASPEVLAQLKLSGVDDAAMLLHGRWALAELQAAQARDAAAEGFATALASLLSCDAAYFTQQRVMQAQLRLALQGNPTVALAFGLTKAPSKRKAATKAGSAG